jgi:hypothetical protein
MRHPIVVGALVAFALVVACGGKVADGESLGVSMCTTTDPRGSTCANSGDACRTTLTSCDGTSAESTCYCTGQNLWSCDMPEKACACIPGGACSTSCTTELQADCGWYYQVTCACDESTHTYTCNVPSCANDVVDAGVGSD